MNQTKFYSADSQRNYLGIRAHSAFRLALGLVIGALGVVAFPPAPHHLITGTVRDQFGNPIAVNSATITLTTLSSNTISGSVIPFLHPGINYQLTVPMDSGLTDTPYKATALLPAMPFTMSVKMGGISYLPIEMKGKFSKLGQPGEQSQMDLTLGQDSDNNGLPDAWEQSLFAKLGLVWKAGSIDPNSMLPGSGLSYYQAYVAGAYNYAPTNGFTLNLVRMNGSAPHLAFTAVQGRSYSIKGGTKIGDWSDVSFTLFTNGTNSSPMNVYEATMTQKLEVEVPIVEGQAPAAFFRLMVE